MGRGMKCNMFVEVIPFMCSYVAECILSAIASFIVHLLGEGDGQL